MTPGRLRCPKSGRRRVSISAARSATHGESHPGGWCGGTVVSCLFSISGSGRHTLNKMCHDLLHDSPIRGETRFMTSRIHWLLVWAFLFDMQREDDS